MKTLCLLVSLAALSALGDAQAGRISLLLFNQPPADSPRSASIDLTPYVARELEQGGGFAPIVFKSTSPAVKEALAAGRLGPADVLEPLAMDRARRIAAALGARALLRLSAHQTPAGVAAEAEMEQLAGQGSWISVFHQRLDPYKNKGAKTSSLEGIFAQTAVILERVTGKHAPVSTSDPVSVKLDDPPASGRKPPDSAPMTPPQTPVAAPPKPGPNNYALQADHYRRLGDTANQVSFLRKAVDERPRDPGLRRELVRAYLERGLSAQARQEAARAAALAPQDPGIRLLLAETLMKEKDAEGAARELLEALKKNPKDAAAHTALGDAYRALGKLDESEKAYAAAAEADPGLPAPHWRLARIHAERGRYRQAAESAGRALKGAANADPGLTDFAELLRALESAMGEILARIHANRRALVEGMKTREQAFSAATADHKQSEEIGAFFEALRPPGEPGRVHSLYAQAAALVTQAADAALQAIEDHDTARDEEVSLLRLEASRQLTEASRRLKALLSPDAAREPDSPS